MKRKRRLLTVGFCVLVISLIFAMPAFAAGEVKILGTLTEDGKHFKADDGTLYSLIIDQNIERPLKFLAGKRVELTGVTYTHKRAGLMMTTYRYKELGVKVTGMLEKGGKRLKGDDGNKYELRIDDKNMEASLSQLDGKRVELSGEISEDELGGKLFFPHEYKPL